MQVNLNMAGDIGASRQGPPLPLRFNPSSLGQITSVFNQPPVADLSLLPDFQRFQGELEPEQFLFNQDFPDFSFQTLPGGFPEAGLPGELPFELQLGNPGTIGLPDSIDLGASPTAEQIADMERQEQDAAQRLGLGSVEELYERFNPIYDENWQLIGVDPLPIDLDGNPLNQGIFPEAPLDPGMVGTLPPGVFPPGVFEPESPFFQGQFPPPGGIGGIEPESPFFPGQTLPSDIFIPSDAFPPGVLEPESPGFLGQFPNPGGVSLEPENPNFLGLPNNSLPFDAGFNVGNFL